MITFPTKPIEDYSIELLIEFYKYQVFENKQQDKTYLDYIRKLLIDKYNIESKSESVDTIFPGDGCCSEWRNSQRFLIEDFNKIINKEI